MALLFILLTSATFVAAQQRCYDQGSFSQAEFPYCKELSDEYALHWRIDRGYITYGIAVVGKYSMIGLGISDSGGMRGTDMVILLREESITAGTAWQVGDYWSTDFVTPTRDEKQDYQLVSYAGTAQTTLATVKRALDTADPQDHKVYFDTDQLVVFAYGDGLEYHGPNRGWQVLRLWPSNYNTTLNITSLLNESSTINAGNNTEYTYRQALIAQDPPDLTDLSLALPKVSVPASQGTQHRCVAAALPADSKYHIIRYKGVPDSTVTPSPVISMRLYGCTTQPSTLLPYDCGGVPDRSCNIPLGFWGTGMKASLLLPPEAGIAFGNGTGLATFAMLVVQYNATSKPLKDSSGFLLHYTAQLRPYDLGIVQLGSAPPAATDPLSRNRTLPDYCPASCTSRLQYNLSLVTNYLSMDMYGQAVITRHIGNNTNTSTALVSPRAEMQPLGSKSYWWMGWQSFKQVLPNSRVFLPGDSLTTQCNASTGFVGRCVNWVHYYPAVSGWSACGSLPSSQRTLLPLATCSVQQTYRFNTSAASNRSVTLPADVSALAATLQSALSVLTSPQPVSVNSTTPSVITPPTQPLTRATLDTIAVLAAQGLMQLNSLPTLLTDLTTRLQTPTTNTTVSHSLIQTQDNITSLIPSLSTVTGNWTVAAFNALWRQLTLNNTLVGPVNGSVTVNTTAQPDVTVVSLATLLSPLVQLGAAGISGAGNGGASGGLRVANVSGLAAVAFSAVGGARVADLVALVRPNALLQVLPVSVIMSTDTVYLPYTEPYDGPPPPPPPHYETGHALAAIIALTIGLSGVLAFLWVNYARKEDPERQALLAALQQTILEEATNHPDLTEDQLQDRLRNEIEKRLQDGAGVPKS